MRVILTLLLMVTSVPAWAEWEKVGETDALVAYLPPGTSAAMGYSLICAP